MATAILPQFVHYSLKESPYSVFVSLRSISTGRSAVLMSVFAQSLAGPRFRAPLWPHHDRRPTNTNNISAQIVQRRDGRGRCGSTVGYYWDRWHWSHLWT